MPQALGKWGEWRIKRKRITGPGNRETFFDRIDPKRPPRQNRRPLLIGGILCSAKLRRPFLSFSASKTESARGVGKSAKEQLSCTWMCYYAISKRDGGSAKEANCMSRKPKLGTLDFCRAKLLLACAPIFAVLIGMPCSSRSQTPADDVASQVRSQGYACDEPVTARRDVKLSKPDLAVWVLNCRNVTYRVRLDPNMAAHVIKLKHHH
jgi:hypothetical protein